MVPEWRGRSRPEPWSSLPFLPTASGHTLTPYTWVYVEGMGCRQCETLEQMIDNLLWAVDHTERPNPGMHDQAAAILTRARAHNSDWHNARALRSRLIVDVRDPAPDRVHR